MPRPSGHATRVAVVGFAGGRFQHVADDDHGGSAKNGSIVRRPIGHQHMSDSLIAFQPAIDEPSNISPRPKTSSSIMVTSKVTAALAGAVGESQDRRI